MENLEILHNTTCEHVHTSDKILSEKRVSCTLYQRSCNTVKQKQKGMEGTQ